MANQVFVSNLEELNQALANATGGETIVLRDGDYGDFEFVNTSFASTVTLVAENPQGAVFNTIRLGFVDNLTFDGIELAFENVDNLPTFFRAFNVTDSNNITVVNSELHGSEDGDLDNDTFLFSARDSNNIIIDNTEFHNAIRAVIFQDVDDIVVTNNFVHTIRSDGFDFVGTNNVLIDGNRFTNFFPNIEAGDHSDGVQFFNNVDNPSQQNITITNNTFLIGDGLGFQSIFVENDLPNGSFVDVVISNNLIVNDNGHGITLTDAVNAEISNNTLTQIPGAQFQPGINILRSTENINLIDNVTPRISIFDISEVNDINNVIIDYNDDDSPNFITNLFFNGLVGREAVVEDFTPIPGSLLSGPNGTIGAFTFDAAPDALTALFSSQTFAGTSEALTVEFDATFSADSTGILDDDDATFTFDFGDGNVVEGANVRHTFAEAGIYEVTVTVDRGGVADSFTQTVFVPNPRILETSDLTEGAVNSDLVFDNGQTAGRSFDGTEVVNLGRPPELFGLDELYISLDIRPDSADAGTQFILSNPQRYAIFRDGDDLHFLLFTGENEQRHSLVVENADIFDGEFHNVAVSFDSDTGVFRALIDGEVVGSVSGIDGIIGNIRGNDVTLGGGSGSRNFEGDIRNLEAFSSSEPLETGTARTEVLSGPGAGQTIEGEPTEEPVDDPAVEPVTEDPAPEPDAAEEAVPESENATYQLRSGNSVELSGGATETNGVFSFDGSGLANLGRPDEFSGSDEVAISFDLRAGDANGNGAQRVFWDHARYGVELKGDTLNFRLFTDEGEFINIQVRDSGVTDGEYHNIAFTFDSGTGTFAAFVDGVEVGRETGILGDLNAASNRDITLGGSTSGRDFDGEIRDLRLFDDVDVAAAEVGLGTVTLEASVSAFTAAPAAASVAAASDSSSSTAAEDAEDDWAGILTGNDF